MEQNTFPFGALSVPAFRDYLDQLWDNLLFSDGVFLPGENDPIERGNYEKILSFFLPSYVVEKLEPVLSGNGNQGRLTKDAYSQFCKALMSNDFHLPADLRDRWEKVVADRTVKSEAAAVRQRKYDDLLANARDDEEKESLLPIRQRFKEEVDTFSAPFVKNALAAVEGDHSTKALLEYYRIKFKEEDKDEIHIILTLLWLWVSALPHEEGAKKDHQKFVDQLGMRIKFLAIYFSEIVRLVVQSSAFLTKPMAQIIMELVSKNDEALFQQPTTEYIFAANNDVPDQSYSHHK